MAPLRREWWLLLALAACQRGTRGAARVDVPRTTGALTIDGKQIEPDWNQVAKREKLLGGDGDLARPYSEARFLRDGDTLYVGLYAADEDVRSTDAFSIAIGNLTFQVDARGQVTPAVAGVRAAVDIDEDTTVDKPDDYDEEWVLEVAIPIAAIGPTAHASIGRCDTPKDGVQRCGSWQGDLAL